MKMACFSINNQMIGDSFSPYIIAEMSGNHNHSMEQAIAILDAAVRVGANAIKLQCYTADTVTLDSRQSDFYIEDPDSLWCGRYLYELYEEAHTPWDMVEEIYKEADKRNLVCFSSVFDESSVDFMESLGAPAYKIASFENNHFPLIRKAAKTKKPLIISTGTASEEEVEEAVEVAREAGCDDLALLKCTSDYPAKMSDSNVSCIPYMKTKFDCVVGLSDHTLGISAAVAGVALGASIIEKHFIVSRTLGGVDSAFSADEEEFFLLVHECIGAYESVGRPTFETSSREQNAVKFKRSIYASKSIKEGETLTRENIRIVRPGLGLHPRFYDEILGTRSKKNIDFGEPLDGSCVDH